MLIQVLCLQLGITRLQEEEARYNGFTALAYFITQIMCKALGLAHDDEDFAFNEYDDHEYEFWNSCCSH